MKSFLPSSKRTVDMRRLALGLALGVGVTVGVGYFAARQFDWRIAWATLTHADPAYLALALAAMWLNIALKTLRWQWLFGPQVQELGRARLLSALMIGQLGNVLLPTRLGDLARIWAVSSGEQRVGLTLALWTVVAEKALDSVMLLAVLAALLPFVALPAWLSTAQLVLSGLLATVLVLLVLLASQGRLRQRLLHTLQRLPLGHVRDWAERAMQSLQALRALQDRTVQLRLCASSIAIWLLAGAVNHFGFQAVHLDLPFTAGLLLAATEVAGTRVAYTPAAVGVYHSIAILTLALFGVGFEPALGAAVLLHLVVYLPILIGGLLAVWWEGLDLRRVPQS